MFAALQEVARVEGHKSQDAKVKLINKLLASAATTEPAFLVRALQGKLRIGLAEQSVLTALAHAVALQVRGPHFGFGLHSSRVAALLLHARIPA